MATFKERFQELKKKAGFTNEKIAEKLNLSEDRVKKWNDKALPTLEHMVKLADIFQVSVDYMLGRDDCTSVENEYIHEVTGLSDKALKKLKSIKKGRPEALYAVNRLLEYSHRPALDRIGTFFYYGNANLKGIVKSLPSLDNPELIEQISYDMSLDCGSDYELYIYDKDNNLFPVSIDMALFEDIKDQLKDIRNSIRKNNDF